MQKRKYNGKEFVEMHGYDTYDYGARGMYPAIGSFATVDPLCEKYYSISPYVYCAGNPVKYIDPDGKWIANPKSPGTIEIRNGLYQTERGRELYNEMVKADYPVTFVLSSGSNSNENAGFHYKINTETGKIQSGTITVFKGNAEDILQRVKSVTENPNATIKSDAPEDMKARVENKTATVSEIIGQEAAHEIGHFTRKNLNDNNSEDKKIKEGEPNAEEIKVIKQKMHLLPTPKFKPFKTNEP